MDKFRHTSIKTKKKNCFSAIEGDLVESGAIIFTKTQVDMQTIKRGDAFWRLLIRMIQWFRWSRTKGDPSTITHVDGWDGALAFGSDLCDPEGGGLNRHVLPIVPHCFLKPGSLPHRLERGDESVEVSNKKHRSYTLKADELATSDFEVFQLPEHLKRDFLNYQEKFRNDDIRYSLKNAAKTVITNAKFCLEAKRIAIADGIYVLLGQPFRDQQGGVLEVCCSTFLAKVLMAIEHKQRMEAFIDLPEFEFSVAWKRNFSNLKMGFKELNRIHSQLIALEKEFDQKWGKLNEKKTLENSKQLIELCVDFTERKNFHIRRIHRLSGNLAKRIYKMAGEILKDNLYEKYFDQKERPILFKMNPDRVTPAKLYSHLLEIIENEP